MAIYGQKTSLLFNFITTKDVPHKLSLLDILKDNQMEFQELRLDFGRGTVSPYIYMPVVVGRPLI